MGVKRWVYALFDFLDKVCLFPVMMMLHSVSLIRDKNSPEDVLNWEIEFLNEKLKEGNKFIYYGSNVTAFGRMPLTNELIPQIYDDKTTHYLKEPNWLEFLKQ